MKPAPPVTRKRMTAAPLLVGGDGRARAYRSRNPDPTVRTRPVLAALPVPTTRTPRRRRPSAARAAAPAAPLPFRTVTGVVASDTPLPPGSPTGGRVAASRARARIRMAASGRGSTKAAQPAQRGGEATLG